MPADVRTRAEVRLAASVAAGAFADPRPPLRERLRQLREANPGRFEEARSHYERQVLPELAEAAEPLVAWAEYGAFVGEVSGPGQVLAVDAGGSAVPYAPPPAPGSLLLHVPDDTAAPVLVIAAPADPSPAQQATLDLLVHRRLSL